MQADTLQLQAMGELLRRQGGLGLLLGDRFRDLSGRLVRERRLRHGQPRKQVL